MQSSLQMRSAAEEMQPSRDEIVRQHMGLVHQTVSRICGPVARAQGKHEDLISAGMIGLLNAFDAFDASRGVAFSTYAAPRIRGAVLDELRRLDFVPRSVRSKARAVSKARAAVSSRNPGPSKAAEVATELGISTATFFQWQLDAEAGEIESIDASPSGPRRVSGVAAEGWGSETAMPDAELLHEEQVASVRNALAALPEQERLVLILYFYEELKLKQIGDLLGVTESRVSQIRTRALGRLRESLARNAA